MTNTWLVLLPTVIVLTSAFTIKKLNTSLILGILSAGLIASNFSIFKMFSIVGYRLWEKLTDYDQIVIFSFLIILGIIVALLAITGGAAAFAKIVTKKVKDSRAAEKSSILLSFSLFIDDYLSNLTVGYVMRPITDKFKIPRAKLAFLVHSFPAALVILVPLTSWGAMITGQLNFAGITTDPTEMIKVLTDSFFTYIKTIPYIFYSFLIVPSVWFIVHRRISYGPMKKHEDIAKKTGNLFGGRTDIKTKEIDTHYAQSSLADLIVPVATLIASIIIGFLYSGGFFLFGGNKSLLGALKNNGDPSFTIFVAGAITLAISFIFAFARKKIKIKSTVTVIKNGFSMMYEPILMLILAITLGNILMKDLDTGGYLANLLMGSFSIKFLPFMLFITAATCGIATGTSWGTIALLTPTIAVPLVVALSQVTVPTTLDKVAILLPSLGAIFSGAICGDHVSPISETTIMAATSSGSDPIDHAYTQFPYAAPAIVSTALAFLLSGLLADYSPWINIFVPLAVGLATCLGLLLLLNKNRARG